MRFFYLFCFLVYGGMALGQQHLVYQWNFNSETLNPSVNNGVTTPSLSLIGGTSSAYVSGDVNGGSTDTSQTNRALNTTNYPEATMAPKTAGIEIAFNATQLENIVVNFDVRASNTAANKLQLQYRAGNENWQDVMAFTIDSGTTWRSFSTSLEGFVNGNAENFVRIVTDFDGDAYAPANNTSNYGSSGTLRYDMVSIIANQLSSVTEKAPKPSFGWNVKENTLQITPQKTVKTLCVMNVTGVVLQKWDITSTEMLQTTLPNNGLYFIIASNGKQHYTQKLSH